MFTNTAKAPCTRGLLLEFFFLPTSLVTYLSFAVHPKFKILFTVSTRLDRADAEPCTWEGRAPCSDAGGGLASWDAALLKRPEGPGGQQAECRPAAACPRRKRPAASQAV